MNGSSMFLHSSENPLSLTFSLHFLFLSVSSMFPLSAVGSFPHLSLEHHDDSVNLSCSSCGWFPQPSLQLESASGKGHALSKQHTIYKVQENFLFCISSWVILSSSVSDKISCSVVLSKDETRTVSLDLGAQIPGLLRKHYTSRCTVGAISRCTFTDRIPQCCENLNSDWSEGID